VCECPEEDTKRIERRRRLKKSIGRRSNFKVNNHLFIKYCT